MLSRLTRSQRKNTMACANVKIKVNDRFSTFKEFEEVLTEYKKSQLQEFWIRDARTISNQRKRFPETVSKANEELKYCYVRLACIRGGRKFKSKNENSTRKCTTLRQDCPASIFLKISPCQQALIVVEINEGHSHSTSKTALNSLSQQRLKLPETMKQHNTPEMIHNTLMETEVSCQILKNDLKASLSSHKKFTIMDGYGKRMAQLSSDVSTKTFYERVNLILKVIEMWEEGKDSVLNENFSRIFETDAEKSQEISIHYEEDSESQESTNAAALVEVIYNKKPILNQSSSIDEKLAETVTKKQLYGIRNSINLQDIKMPRNVLHRERRKGFGNTMIGLKRQKSMKTETTCRTPPVNDDETEQCLKEEYLEEEYLEEYLNDE